MQYRRSMIIGALAALAFAGQAAEAGAQTRDRNLSVQTGGFVYDAAGDQTTPMVAVRADWGISRYVRAEVGVSYARPEVAVGDNSGTVMTYRSRPSNVGTATVALQAQIPFRVAQPYIGVGTGLFGRVDPGVGEEFISTTQEFMGGVRIPVSKRIGIRTELRFRFDDHRDFDSRNLEETIGVTVRF